MINFLTANTGCSSVGGTTIIVSLVVIFALFAINLYSTVVFRKPIKNIWKIIGFICIFLAIGIIFVIGNAVENAEVANLYVASIFSIVSTWIWGFSYFSKNWSSEKYGNDLFVRNVFAIFGIIAISVQIYSLIKFLEMGNHVGTLAVSANIIISSVSFFAMRDDAECCFF